MRCGVESSTERAYLQNLYLLSSSYVYVRRLLKLVIIDLLETYNCLEKFVFKGHVRFWLETDTCAEDVGQSPTLLRQSIDHRSSWRGQRSL